MYFARLFPLALLVTSLAQSPVLADLSAQTLADLQSTDPGARASALRLRALDHQKAGRFAEAQKDFIACLEDTRKTTNRGREAEMFARVAYCQMRLGAFEDARSNMDTAVNQNGWIEDELFFLQQRAHIYLATDQLQKALDIAVRLKASPKESAQALGKHFEACAHYLMGDEASLSMGMGSVLYDPDQLPFNRAIWLDPKSREARVKRARFFTARANQKRFPDFYPATTPTTKGGWLNLIDSALLDVQPHTFYQSAYYDWSRAISLEKRSADYAERALVASQWNQVATGTEKIAPSRIQSDILTAENRGERDPETLRALARYYENNLPKIDDPDYRPTLRRAIVDYSLSVTYAPTAPENKEARESRQNLIGMFFSHKPLSPAVKPKSAGAWKALGNELVQKQEQGAAMEAYEKALELDPKYADAVNNIGSQYVKAGAYDIGIEWFSKAIATDPKHRIAYFNRSSVYRDIGENDNAFKDAALAIQFAVTPAQKVDALDIRSELYYSSDQLDNALIDIDNALKVDGERPDLWALKGQIELETGSPSVAMTSFNEVIKRTKNASRVQGLLMVATLLQNGEAPARLTLSSTDLSWVESYLKKPRFEASYNKTPQKERLEQARKLVLTIP